MDTKVGVMVVTAEQAARAVEPAELAAARGRCVEWTQRSDFQSNGHTAERAARAVEPAAARGRCVEWTQRLAFFYSYSCYLLLPEVACSTREMCV